jgi:hypothetical protein
MSPGPRKPGGTFAVDAASQGLVTVGAGIVADDVTSAMLNVTGVPGVMLTGQGLNAQVVNRGRFTGQTNVTFSPF